ncbi:MAG: inositol monophosphatase [Proteobacteria bacterium]|nr:inositol monophosphatase [Pseudomonadota bacterium]
MTETDIQARFAAARVIAREAGGLALGYFRDYKALTVEFKDDRSQVSEADSAVEKLIGDRLWALFPEDAFLGEETGSRGLDGKAPGVWVVDPIDGTSCFVAGLPVWCVSIAYLAGGEVEIGVIFNPNADEMFTVSRGHGAHLNGDQIRCSQATSFSEGMVGIGHSPRLPPAPALAALERLLGEGGAYVEYGSAALMIAYVAAGRLLGYYEAHLNSWDCAAALALARETGCWDNDFLAGDGLIRGNPIAVAAPGLAEGMKRVSGLG